MLKYLKITTLILVAIFCLLSIVNNKPAAFEKKLRVIYLSVDGLRSDAIPALGPEEAPNFHFLIKNGASTLNARTDQYYTTTLPNHTSMLTARPVRGSEGHNASVNSFKKKTIHEYKGEYVTSIFDTLKENKLTSALVAAKAKFVIYPYSYGLVNPFFDIIPIIKNGKIDHFYTNNGDDDETLKQFLNIHKKHKPDFTFLHFVRCDKDGHKYGWSNVPGSHYLKIVKHIDSLLGEVIARIKDDETLGYSTVLILTSDHGGNGDGHGNFVDPLVYTIPFIVWGKGVAKGKDLYEINKDSRIDPQGGKISMRDTIQPIRNADGANLALQLLGLGPIEGSVTNYKQDLNVSALE